MKKPLLNFLLFVFFAVFGNTAIAAVPTISYTPANPYTVGSPMSLSPTSPTGVSGFTYGTGIPFTGGTLNKPYGLTFDATGNVCVANYATAANNVLKYSSAGVYSGSVFIAKGSFPSGSNPTSVGFDNAGNAYAAETGGYLYKFTSAGAYSSPVTTAPNAMNGMFIDASNNIYLADLTDKVVYKYSTTGTRLLTISANLSGPVNVGVDGAGNIYVLDNTNKSVLKYNAAGTYLSTPVTGLTNPFGLFVDSSGNIYVGDTGTTSVKVYSPAGGLISSITGISDPRGVLVDTKGTVYVSNYTANTITKYIPAGGYFLNYAAGTTSLPSGLTFDSTTGIISGTPGAAFSGSYTVTGYNASGPTISSQFTITCVVGAPNISYPTPDTYLVGGAVSLSPSSTGGTITSYAAPSLPAGLTIAAGTGIISGNVTTAGTGNYVVTATGPGGSYPFTINITVNNPPAPIIAYTTPDTYVTGAAVSLSPNSTGGPVTTYSAPTLPAGLTIVASTGVISGTVTTATPATNYIVTATNAGGSYPFTINITVNNPPAPNISYTTPDTYIVGATVSLSPSSTGGPVASYAAPSLPAGLSINATTGVISGSPTTASAATNYIVTATNAGGSYPFTINITINPKAPVFTYTTPDVYTAGTAITTLTPTVNSGSGTITYTVSPALPGGLSIAAATGYISGTPTAYTATATYTVTGTNITGSSTFAISITVNQKPVFTYSPNSYTFTVGTAIPSTITPINTGGAVPTTGFGTGTALSAPGNYPQGLAFDASGNLYVADNTSTGRVKKYTAATGTPVAVGPTFSYPVGLVFDALGNSYVLAEGTSTVIKVNSSGTAVTFNGPTFNSPDGIAIDANNNIYVADYDAGSSFTGTITGLTSTGAVFMTISTNINGPTGVAVDAAGNIYALNEGSGNVTKYDKNGNYISTIITGLGDPYAITIDASGNIYVGDSGNDVVNMYNSSGTLLYTFSSNVVDPEGIAVDVNGNVYISDYFNYTIYKNPPVGGYYLSGTLPPGLLFNTNTGQFTGTPTVGFASTTYTVTAYNATGSNSTTITFACPTSTPSITYTPATNIYVVGTAITTLTPANSGGPAISYNINTVLPAGLLFNPNTGTISGTPTVVTATTIYTITATNSAGSNTTTETITINPKAPVITYLTPDIYAVGATVSLSPNNTGGAVATYTVNTTLPAGLILNAATGVISGTTTANTAAANYIVTATNVTGTSSFTINIGVDGLPVVTYNPSTNNFPVNVAITPITTSNTGGPLFPAGYNSATSFETITSPYGLAINSSGNVYATSYTGKTITEYNLAGTAAVITFTVPYKPTGIAVDAAGNMYVVFGNGYVYKYNSSGIGAVFISTVYYAETGNSNSFGIAIDGSGNLFIADPSDNVIWKYTASTGNTAVLISGLSKPVCVQVDAAGNIFETELGTGTTTGTLKKFNSTGSTSTLLLSNLYQPYGLFVDAADNYYIGGSTATGTVTEYTSNGATFAIVGAGIGSPRGIVTDQSGNVYVTDNNNSVIDKYTPYFYVLPVGSPLPTGLLLNPITGAIYGTPTVAVDPGQTYTVNIYGFGQVKTTATVIIRCYTSYDWIGTQSTALWYTTSNWLSGVVPGSGNTANIGVNNTFAYAPVVSVSTSVGSIVMGNKGGQAASVTAASGVTLTVNGDITKQSDASSAATYATSSLLGTGTINAVNVNVMATTTTATGTYTDGINSSISNLVLSGNINLTSTNSTYAANAAFTISGGLTSFTNSTNGIIVTTNATGSTSNLNMTGGTLQWVNPMPLSGLSANGTNKISLTGGIIDYHGAAQTVYTTAAVPNLSSVVRYNGIAFSGTGIKTLAGGATDSLDVAGNFTNALANDAADNVSLKNTLVNFNGTAAQALAGGTASINYGSIFNTVNFSNAGTKTMSGAFYVASTGTLNMSSGATLVAGDNVSPTPATADAYLTLLSDVNGAATVPAIPSGCAINGNVNVQRYVTGGTATYRGYRMLSSPVNAGGGIFTINYVKNNVYLTGTSGTGGGFDGGTSPTLYLFRENLLPSNNSFTSGNFRGVNNITASPSYTIDVDGSGFQIPVGNGYQMFYRGDRSAAAYATETTPSYVPTADTLMATGFLNQGNIVVKDWYTSSSTNLGYTTISQSTNIEGYNLLGNPYASSINFDTYSTTNSSAGLYAPGVNPFVYILDPVSKNYNVYQAGNGGAGTIAHTGSNIIASGQGFFVVANTASAQFIFNEAAKIISQATAANGNLFLALQQNQPSEKSYLRLELNKDTINRDAIFINFNTAANAGYTANEDAPYKVGHGFVSLASRSADGISLAINTTPYPKQSQPIPLNVSASLSGTFTLRMTDKKNMPDMYDIWLKDAYMKDSLDIKHNTTYTFDVNTADTNSYGNNRFSLIIRQDPALSLHLLSFTAKKVTSTVLTNWTVENEANYTKFNLLKSADGIAFSSLDSLLSNGTGAYAFTDSKPQTVNYYKLQLTDLAGNISFSSVVQVGYANTTKATNNLTVYPNPTNSMINIAVNQGIIATSGLQNQTTTTTAPTTGQTYDIKITNMTGEVLKTVTSASATWQNNVSSLLPGTYVIQVFSHGSSSVVGRTTFVKL